MVPGFKYSQIELWFLYIIRTVHTCKISCVLSTFFIWFWLNRTCRIRFCPYQCPLRPSSCHKKVTKFLKIGNFRHLKTSTFIKIGNLSKFLYIGIPNFMNVTVSTNVYHKIYRTMTEIGLRVYFLTWFIFFSIFDLER